MTFVQGDAFTALTPARNGSSGGQQATGIYPAYRIVSAIGSCKTSATLNSGHRWAAAIATYKAMPITL